MNKVNGTYHKDVYMPNFKWQNVEVVVYFTRHALQQAERRNVRLPKSVNFTDWELVEVSVRDNVPFKVVVRKPYSVRRDLVMVVDITSLNVVTCWTNNIDDEHGTLDASKYLTA